MCEEGKLLVTRLLYMKLTLHIPLGHGCACTNVPFVLGAVVVFVIVWCNGSDGIIGWRAKVEDGQEWNGIVEQTKTHPGV